MVLPTCHYFMKENLLNFERIQNASFVNTTSHGNRVLVTSCEEGHETCSQTASPPMILQPSPLVD